MPGRLTGMGSGKCRAEHQTPGSVWQGETEEGGGGLLGMQAANGPSSPGAWQGPVLLARVSTHENAQVQESPAPAWVLRTGEIWGCFLINSCHALG